MNIQSLQADPNPEPAMGSFPPVQDLQGTQGPIRLQEYLESKEDSPVKSKISQEVKCLGQTHISLPRAARNTRQLISYDGMIGTVFLSYTVSRGVTAE